MYNRSDARGPLNPGLPHPSARLKSLRSSILHVSVSNDNISGLAAFPRMTLVIAIRATRSSMIRIPTHMTSTFLLVILLLEVLVLDNLILPIKLCFTIKLSLVLEFVGLEVSLLYLIGTRTSLNTSSMVILCSHLFFHIKSTNEIWNGKLLPLMLQ